uniref:Uncharacterized protein n=1 Tax=Arundo donax TaxID=35708 RepID=A0A0A9A5B5_ARUDO
MQPTTFYVSIISSMYSVRSGVVVIAVCLLQTNVLDFLILKTHMRNFLF